jgi:hypothetical protein
MLQMRPLTTERTAADGRLQHGAISSIILLLRGTA